MFGNWLKTSILMAGIMALFGAIGASLGGANGMLLALLVGGGMNVFSYWFSDKMVLKMYNAQEVDEVGSRLIYNMVQGAAARAQPADAARLSDRRGRPKRFCHRAQP
jgi:heat shock protein HtpX